MSKNQIFFVTVAFADTVHAPALGFTEQIYDYAEAPDHNTAIEAVKTFYDKKYGESLRKYNNSIKRVTAKLAARQNGQYSGLITPNGVKRQRYEQQN